MVLLLKKELKFCIFIIIDIIIVGCTNSHQTVLTNQGSINSVQDIYQSLSITPQPNNQLCWYDADLSVDNWDSYITNPAFEDGLAYSLMIQNVSVIGNSTYQLQPNVPNHITYRGYYRSSTNTEAFLPIRYIAFLNERQLTNVFANEEIPYQDMVFNSHQTQTFDMTIPSLDEGIHELVVIGIEQAELFNDGRVGVFAIRATFIVGNPLLSIDRTTYELIQPYEYRNSSNFDTYWSLTAHSDQSHLMWVYPDIYKPVKDKLDFYMSVGYMEQADMQAQHNIIPNPQPIALITLLDYVQVPIQKDKLVFYGLLSSDNSYSYIPATIDLDGYTGKKELLIIQISYPRVPYCLLIPTMTEREGFYFYFRIDVERYGIDVQN